ncbi:MAG: hypothetical protein J1E41_02020 [Ruminococcus sp.]|nr:hypothetical protein [Ruminococcus sp.]
MTEKRRCPNCGAYLTNSDKTCYVCGEVLAPETLSEQNTSEKTYTPAIPENNIDNDFTKPYIPVKDTNEPEYSDRYDSEPYVEENSRPYFYDEDEDFEDKEKNNTKKTAIICGIIVGVAALAAVIVGVCFSMGLFSEKNSDEVTVYFDKPSVSLNLMDDDGTVYNWGADVSVSFKLGNKEQQQSCNLCLEYDNMWKCTVPANATDVYFFQDSGEEIRTAAVRFLENDTVYYVTEILFNADGQLPISSCRLNEFDNLGVNATDETTPATTAAKTTTAPTEKVTEKETEKETETEKPTEALSNPYNISVPNSWSDGAIEITNDNCVSYYETYNYQNYGTGMLLSVYTFKAGDNSYGDLNAKKILTASDGSKIVIVTPSDVQFDDSDETAMNNYISLSNLTNQVIKSIKTN